MRNIYLEDQCRVRFPHRTADFDDGVEVGMLAALMVLGKPHIIRWVTDTSIPQLRSLGDKLGYRLITETADNGWTKITLHTAAARPKLRLVSSI